MPATVVQTPRRGRPAKRDHVVAPGPGRREVATVCQDQSAMPVPVTRDGYAEVSEAKNHTVL